LMQGVWHPSYAPSDSQDISHVMILHFSLDWEKEAYKSTCI
jgi:hypothetical protein